nr:MAG TPA: hypothetical protein [Bacteriophage sp.]
MMLPFLLLKNPIVTPPLLVFPYILHSCSRICNHNIAQQSAGTRKLDRRFTNERLTEIFQSARPVGRDRNKGERKRGISQSDLRDWSLSQSRDITLTQIPVKMFPIFSHVTLTSL